MKNDFNVIQKKSHQRNSYYTLTTTWRKKQYSVWQKWRNRVI